MREASCRWHLLLVAAQTNYQTVGTACEAVDQQISSCCLMINDQNDVLTEYRSS